MANDSQTCKKFVMKLVGPKSILGMQAIQEIVDGLLEGRRVHYLLLVPISIR